MAGEIKYEIIEELGVIYESAKGWTKELNLISWNGGAPKYDVRDWAPEHEKMGKGVTLSEEEAKMLFNVVSTNGVKYDHVSSYNDLKNIIGLKG